MEINDRLKSTLLSSNRIIILQLVPWPGVEPAIFFYHAPNRGGSTQCCHLPVRQWLMFSFLIGERKSMAYARHAHWGVLNRSNGRSRFSIYVICSRISNSQMTVFCVSDTDNMPTYDFPVNTLQFILLFEWYLPLDSRIKAAFTLVLF